MKPEWIALPSLPPPQHCSQAGSSSHSAWHIWTGAPPGSISRCWAILFSVSPSLLLPPPWTCLFLLLCAVGSFSEHLDQINGRSECVDSTDNTSKPSSEPASHMARQRLENTEKKRLAGKVTKSLSASALSLMIPGGRETSARMKLCDLCMCSPPSSPNLECQLKCKIAWGNHGWDCRTTLKNFGLTHFMDLGAPRKHVHICLSYLLCLGVRPEMFPSRKGGFHLFP